MATIQTAIRLQDQMTAPLRNMLKTMDIVINSFERMQKVIGISNRYIWYTAKPDKV